MNKIQNYLSDSAKLILFSLLITSFFISAFKRKNSINKTTYQYLFNLNKKEILKNKIFNYKLKSVYFYDGNSTVPPIEQIENRKKRTIDSLNQLGIRVKQFTSFDCHNIYWSKSLNANDNYKVCDSIETYEYIIDLTNKVFSNNLRDSILKSTRINKISISEDELRKLIQTRLQLEINRLIR